MHADGVLDTRHTQDIYRIETYTDVGGRRFRIEHHYDLDMAGPWEQDGAYGHVSGWTTRSKRPSEFVLTTCNNKRRFYDYGIAVRRARNEGLRGRDAADTVLGEFRRMRDWCRNEWHYMGILVYPLTVDGEDLYSNDASLWGIESDTDAAHIQSITEDLLREAGAELWEDDLA